MSLLTCRFVPGTTDAVRVHSHLGGGVVPLSVVRSVLGRPALEGLYLRGAYIHEDHEDQIWFILMCLGCPSYPEGPVAQDAARAPLGPPDRPAYARPPEPVPA